jgi:hypothetical protein
MNDEKSVKERLSSLTSRAVGRDSEDEVLEDLGICGWLHGIRDRALFLELRFKTGNIHALGYSWLEHAEFDPSEGITLYFVGHMVKVCGSNLHLPLRNHIHLFDALLRHRVPWIQEMDRPSASIAGEKQPIITKIQLS